MEREGSWIDVVGGGGESGQGFGVGNRVAIAIQKDLLV